MELTDPTELALLAAVRAAPADDVPRLAFADWLDEHGDPDRAEFVRVQCELAGYQCLASGMRHTCNPTAKGPRCGVLRTRERELLDADDARTLAWFGLPQPWARIARLAPFDADSPDYPYAVVRRGFVHSVTCTAEQWVAHGDAARALHPVEAVTLTTWPQFYSGGGVRLVGDPTGRNIMDWVREESLRGLDNPELVLAVLGRRWRGVMFTYSAADEVVLPWGTVMTRPPGQHSGICFTPLFPDGPG